MTTSINTFRTLFVSLSSISVVLLLTMSISAQTTTTSSGGTAVQFPNNPQWRRHTWTTKRRECNARFTDFRRNVDPEQQRFAYPTAKAYLRRWGSEKDAETKEVIKWVAEYERQSTGPSCMQL